MPATRRRYPKARSYKSRASKNKKSILTKIHAKAQQSQLMSIQKQVNNIKTQVKDTTQYAQYQFNLNETDLEHNWNVFQLTKPDQWSNVFQSSTETNNANKFRIKKLSMETYISINSPELPCPPQVVTFFLVSLRKETAALTLQDLGGIGLPNFNTAGVNDYYNRVDFGGGTYQGLVRINPAAFKIHKVERFEIQNILNWIPGTDDQAVNTPIGVRKRFYMKATRGNIIKSATQKRWKQMEQEDCAHTDLLYVLVHVGGADNVAPNPPLSIAYNAVFSGRGTN